MPVYRADLPPLPDRWRHLPLDERGFPVPWFVAYVDGKPDFRVVRANGVGEAWGGHTCWLCGHKLGVYLANVIGPMCGINRVTSEPPQHLECAEYAVKACPFLSRPAAVRRERNLPEERHVPGNAIPRNPGVALIWVTKTVRPFRDGRGGVLFKLGDPVSWSFWREGRRATREEVEHSVNTGLPALMEPAEKEGRASVVEVRLALDRFKQMWPAPAKEATP